ncbi:MAG: hook-length control protein FliK [Candidatus Nitrotoga sp. LAW]|nr:MAG: hook-length control protein FliK [Candidatus Nitrotoga sp. LAW]
MLPVKLLSTLKALTLTQKLPAATVDPTPKTGQFEPGQKIQGIVQTQVSPGLFNVRIGEQLTQMPLPAFIRTGDTIKLQVIATTPRLTFSMSASTNPLSTDEKLSSVARLLSAMSQQPREKTDMRAMQSTPLWTTPQTMQSGQLAGLLHEALDNSGLFYESHQAQWLEGARSTTQLLQEPQNSTRTNPSTNMEVSSMLGGNISSASQMDTIAPIEGKTPIIPDHLQPLVQQQINALETRQVLWQGNIWPNQAMQWEIHEQTSQTPAVENEQQWTTQIHLDLPNLGMVSATLSFNSAGLSLILDASTTATRTILGNTSSQLVATMSDRGIPIVSTLVTQHETT